MDVHHQQGQLVCPKSLAYLALYVTRETKHPAWKSHLRHSWYYGRCQACFAEYSAMFEGNATVPRLSDLNQDATATWAEQIEKGSIAREPFWIHNMTARTYQNDQGQDVAILVCEITLNGPSRRDPRAVIVLGHTEDRQPYLDYFENERERAKHGQITEPIGPVITYEVQIKGGRSFWRLEDAPDDDDMLPGMGTAASAKKGK